MIDDPFDDWDAAYVLGALSMDERRDFERHLSSCATCSTSVAELAGIPGILSKINTDSALALINAPIDAEESQLEPDLVQNLARLVAQHQSKVRRRYTIGMSMAAAALIVIDILAGNGLSSTAPTGTVIAMTQVQPNVMTASLRVTDKSWGTRFDWNCNYVGAWSARYSSVIYNLVITDTSGKEYTIATWSSPQPTVIGLTATSNFHITQIRTVEIRTAGSTVPLVRGQI